MSELINNLSRFHLNPGAIQKTLLDHLEQVTQGDVTVVDPSNPFTFLLESSCFNTAMAMQEMVALWRRQYKSLSSTPEDLYYHLADKDFVGLFSTPSEATFVIAMDLEELKQKVLQEDNSRIRKLVIPRHTEFEISGYTFTLQYPIELRLMPHGGLQVVYQNDQPSPLQTLVSNQLEWDVIRVPEQPNPFLRVNVPVQQVRITPQYLDISPSMGLIREFTFTEQFCYARAYISTDSGGWREIAITHQDIVHNLKTMTLALKVSGNTIRVELPPVYVTSETQGRSIRLDIYTTRGAITVDLSSYRINEFGVTWRDLSQSGTNRFSAPLDRFANLFVASYDQVAGGQDALPYDVLRERVLTNAQGDPNLPITQQQMNTMVQLKGYSLVKYVDNVTDRLYHIAKPLPAPKGLLGAGANTTIRNVEIDLDVIRSHPKVYDNGDSVTLTPDILYQDTGREIRLLPEGTLQAIQQQSNEAIVNDVNRNRYLYTPFYYVLDAMEGYNTARAYHLDQPKILSKSFVSENPTTELMVTSGSYYVTKTAAGYRVTVITRSGDAIKAIDDTRLAVQLSFIPVGETQRAYVQGVLRETVDGERVYDFDIVTSHQVDAEHQLTLTNLLMFDEVPRELPCPLVHDWDIMYYVKDHTVPGLEVSEIDQLRATWLATGSYVGLIRERFRVGLGVSLEQLWCKTRVVPGTNTYAVWETDQPKYYDQDVWEVDVDGQIVLEAQPDGTVTGVVLHAQGDPVLDEQDEPVYVHRQGDLKLVDGQPVLVKDRGLRHFVDLYLIEGSFRFTTDRQMLSYRESLPTYITQWLEQDLAVFQERLLERTEMYLHPQNELGLVEVIVGEGSRTSIQAEQAFTVTYHLTSQQYVNVDLRQALTTTARDVIQSHLDRETVSQSEILKSLLEKVDDSVLDVAIEGLGGVNNYSAVTLVNATDRLAIQKRLVNLANEVLTITDDVQVRFIRHLEV